MPETATKTVIAYTDLRSPYTYVAKAEAYRIEAEYGAHLDWYPYMTELANAFGAADARDPREFRKIKYAYMHVRRMGAPQGLTIYGTKRIFDPTVGHVGLLQAKDDGMLRGYHDRAFERVFKRELDPDDRAAIAALLTEVGADAAAFERRLDGPGPAELQAINREAEERGVFGVPAFVYRDELFWGNEALPFLCERLAER